MIQDIAPHKYDVSYLNAEPTENDIVLIYNEDAVLCDGEAKDLSFPTLGEVRSIVAEPEKMAKFMFRIDDINYFEIRSHNIKPFDRWQYVQKEKIRSMKPIWKVFAAITGLQIHNWYTNTTFCGRCGNKMKAHGTERAMRCPACGKVYYPQISPSVIVGVRNGNKLLMTKYAPNHSKYRRYALVAGHAEVGESLEDTVRREVMEEVGLEVKNIKYYGSQPWSYSETILMGFFCDVDGNTEITLDEDELSLAEWMERDEIPEESANSEISLTGTMMKAFKEGKDDI